MTKLKVLTAPHPILKKKALPVEAVDIEERQLMNDMLATMYESNGVGLAANQVGVLKRILVIDLGDNDDSHRPEGFYPLFMANPEIKEFFGKMIEAKEGCLSVPEERIMVTRPAGVKVKYLDYNNEMQELEDDTWLARAIQHEMDHLDGKLLVDYLSNLKKSVVLRRLTKLKNI